MVGPLVSIIIPVYNRAGLVEETLESIIVQTYTNWECIIVDDHSTDTTCLLVEAYCARDNRFSLLRRPKDRLKGANACRNFGFENSNGHYVNWFDSDDLMLPEKLERQVHSLQEHPEMPFTVCQTLVFEGTKDTFIGLRKEAIYSNDFFNDFVTNDIKWLTQAPLLRRSFLLSQNLTYDETLYKSQERDFFVRLLSKVTNYHHDNTPYVLFRKHIDSISYGRNTAVKIESAFKVNYSILLRYRNKLSNRATQYLLQNLKSNLNISVREKYNSQVKDFLDKIFQLELLTFRERIKLRVGILSVRLFKKGDILFK